MSNVVIFHQLLISDALIVMDFQILNVVSNYRDIDTDLTQPIHLRTRQFVLELLWSRVKL